MDFRPEGSRIFVQSTYNYQMRIAQWMSLPTAERYSSVLYNIEMRYLE